MPIPKVFNEYKIASVSSRRFVDLGNNLGRKKIHTMSYCLGCTRVWERVILARTDVIEYYEDFPTYGLERKQCPGCMAEQIINNNERNKNNGTNQADR